MTIYLALTLLVALAMFIVVGRAEFAFLRQYWAFIALPLGVPWTAVALVINEFAPDASGVVMTLVAVSVPVSIGLLYLLGRRLDRHWSSRLHN